MKKHKLLNGKAVKQDKFCINAAALQDHLSRQIFKLPKINPKQLSLAQKLGLVPSPPKPLNQEEWQQIEEQSLKREDISNCICPICLEKFRMQQHVILSCSHIYHKACLESFERVSQTKQCPICRRQDYEKKNFMIANKKYKIQAIIKIQALFRSFRCRKRFYERMVQNGYKPENPLLRRKLIFYKMSRISSKMSKTLQHQGSMAQKAINQLGENFIVKQEQMENNLNQIMQLKQNNAMISLQPIEKVDWQSVKKSALDRKDTECTICLQSMVNCKVFLLSCSHMFHANCLCSFERYSMSQVHCCPNCRQPYQKSHFQLQQ
ncbi:hypothetical protein FGO68_gene14761 [Halteria grandinella]|uniref:RING-type domain-containing protein n=1 Tax=Halteria grandinella TaxID=5974 RepID=A0A8J8SXI6_HALGN|nr:hypothetical protein FGO68_gene14761 [Halteria grandinella]